MNISKYFVHMYQQKYFDTFKNLQYHVLSSNFEQFLFLLLPFLVQHDHDFLLLHHPSPSHHLICQPNFHQCQNVYHDSHVIVYNYEEYVMVAITIFACLLNEKPSMFLKICHFFFQSPNVCSITPLRKECAWLNTSFSFLGSRPRYS